MTPTPTLEPARFHELLTDAVDGFAPASPPVDAMRRRALRRRYSWIGGTVAVVTAAATSAIVLSLTASPSHSSRQVLSIAPAPPPASQGISHPGKLPATLLPGLGPTPASQGPTHRQLRHDQLVCRRYADRHTFLRAVSAVVSGSTVTIYGHRGFEKCGGPDDISFGQHTRLATFTLASGANIGAVVIGRQRDRRITAKALPDYLRHTQFGFFRYTGPPTAITRLIELYHP